MATASYKDSGKMPKKYAGKSTKLGYGGRAAMLKSALAKKGISGKYAGAIIGKIAREKGAAPGQPNYHGK
jgi:hypothetical protein